MDIDIEQKINGIRNTQIAGKYQYTAAEITCTKHSTKKSSHKNLLTGISSRQNRVQHALRSSFILLKQINT